ncbi:MAG: OmpA family protein [Silvanigrellaceae bacterium]
MPELQFGPLTSATLLLTAIPSLAFADEPQVQFRSNERVIRGPAPVPLVLQLGADLGYLDHTTTIPNEGPFTGTQIAGKALASFLFDDWIIEGGAGWSYSALYGTTKSDNPLEPAIGHRIYTQSGFAEGGLRFRLTPKFNLGLVVQDHFGADLTLSQRKNLVNNMFLAGGMMAVDLMSDSGIFRAGATLMAEVQDNQRKVLIYGFTLQFGVPLRGYDTLLRQTDVVVRSEKVKKVEVPKVVTKTIVRDVSKYSLPKESFHFAKGQSTLAPEDQAFTLELANTLRELQSNFKTVTIETHVRSSGDPQRDMRLSELRAQSIRNAIVSAGLNPQRVLSTGLGGRANIDDKSIGSATLVDLSFTGLNNPDQVSEALNLLFRRKAVPETCKGDKCK